jgi:hypothetical protein
MGDGERRRDRWGIYGDFTTEPDAQTCFDLAKAYADMGLLRDAMSELETILRMDPHHVGARAEIAKMHGRLPKP